MNSYEYELIDAKEYLKSKGYERVGSKTKEFFLYFVKFGGSPLSARELFEEFNDASLDCVNKVLRKFVEYGLVRRLPPDMDDKRFSGFRYEFYPEVRTEAWMLLKELHYYERLEDI